MSGTGISQGSISAFGSIFVNAVQWSLAGASIEREGVPVGEAALRVGMVVRIEGDFDDNGATGTALRVVFDDAIEGPIDAPPVETVPGLEKRFTILGETIVVDAGRTVFDGGVDFMNLAADQVLEVSGFVDAAGSIRASWVQLEGVYPGSDRVELRGRVVNPTTNPSDDSGIFDLGSNVVRYTASTVFDGVTRASLANGDLVEVEGTLRPARNEIDAVRVEREDEGLGSGDADEVEIEGIVSSCASAPDFCVGRVPVDASGATFDPPGFVPMPGDFVEVEGALVGGVVIADEIESENEQDDAQDARLEARVTSVDPGARTLVILGVTVTADGETELRDESIAEDESFMFGEILPGDYLSIEGLATGPGQVLADSIRRDDGIDGDDDVRLRGPVTDFSGGPDPTLEILGQDVPIDPMTLFFDELEQSRTAAEFFGPPTSDLRLDAIVEARDLDAADLSILGLADEVEIEDP
jgi:hypothetical protein